MSRVLLTLGHNSYLLPNDRGLTVVLKAMAKALDADDYRYAEKGVVVHEEPIRVQLCYIAESELRPVAKKGSE